ncbi:rifin PIR protein, putative [Plasmodium reichenowi]|uniref:Rifin PIR protein, putative n=1 Tax=Plasmodium reichenowi TaxID=5854 RepID=A0A2P9DSA3_PLARE|nr:rifin PIR protein, putative [Plasmodium reichenowi]
MRSLCECELYEPANYDNDSEMKEVMQQFEDRTSQRFHEYDNRMKTTRQKCKDKCDKEIQKIILKDKLEKELMDKFSTLQTNIESDAIPTCICKKSVADKVEKGCLRCGVVLGGGVAPSVGLLGGIGIYGWKVGFPAAVAKAAAEKAGALAGKAAGDAYGKSAVIDALKFIEVDHLFPNIFKSIGSDIHFYDAQKIASAIIAEYKQISVGGGNTGANWKTFKEGVGILIEADDGSTITQTAEEALPGFMKSTVGQIKKVAESKAAEATLSETAALEKTYMGAVDTAYGGFQTAIIASVIAIVVIVLIMVIIYKILRYGRKKKMKKKLQYIKLLEE